MPKLVNRKTGKSYPATKEQVEAVRKNKITNDLYDIQETEEPAEVKSLKDQQTSEGADTSKSK